MKQNITVDTYEGINLLTAIFELKWRWCFEFGERDNAHHQWNELLNNSMLK